VKNKSTYVIDEKNNHWRFFNFHNHKKAKIAALLIFICFTILSLLFIYKVFNASSNVFNGGFLNTIIKNEPLAKDTFNRTNILVFGTSEDDIGHSGSKLADSILIISVDSVTNNANTISIPRDLWVRYPNECNFSDQGKINAVYYCGINNGKSEQDSSQQLSSLVSDIIGTDIHYYVKVNYTFVRDAVDALGGITVNIQSSDTRGIYDNETGLNLPNGEVQINGVQALSLTRARNAKGGYGLPRSNFDREKNQQLVIRAMQDKALSSGTFTNPIKVTKLADTLSENLLTNVQSNQLKNALSIAHNLPSENIITIDLASKQKPLLTTGQINGQSVVIPVAGKFDYSQIHALIAKEFTTNNNQSL
jgi:LCP family protein required for cell wall assembly